MADVERPGAEQWVPEDPGSGQSGIRSLTDAAAECRGCELWRGATQVVFSGGPASARMMLVGEQPGDREDLEGEPFVGPAGRVLSDALKSAGIDHDDVYVTNAVKHFRFSRASGGKRRIHEKPAVAHIEACHPWLDAELSLVKPQVIVCLGATAGRAVVGRPVRVSAERGRALAESVADARVLVTAHPSAVLRLRGRDGWSEALDQLVGDLEAAAALVEG
jgi:uracil-DNA glycosylase family protein